MSAVRGAVGGHAAAVGGEAYGLLWPHPLFSYQQSGVEKLLEGPSVLLADEMGLGKTIQAIAALRVLARRGDVRSALIVCPAGLVLQWRRHLRLWAPELAISTAVGSAAERRSAWRRDASLYLTSYECLCRDANIRGKEGPSDRQWDVVAIDEAQRIKNPKADTATAIKRLRRTRSWALTGTPLENRLDDLISVLDFVAPGRFDPGLMAVGLRRLVGEVQLRRRRGEVLHDLPPKFASVVTVDLGAAQRRAYRRAEEEGIIWFRALGTRLRISHVLELILRLKQICNFCPESGQSAKFADLRARLAVLTGGGEKVLLFSQFVEEPFGAKRLARELALFRPLLFTGATDPPARAALIAEFERDPARRLMILSLRAGGLGLNLVAASGVFHFDRWWNPAVEAQAEDRVHRIGQRHRVQAFAYLCADTIEERIAAILAAKRALFADLVDGVAMPALARLDLDSLVEAAAPGFRR
jgi:SNF2 family DNA or RNA helicase